MKIPYIAGDYVNVYAPEPDVFQGPDSCHFGAGQRYERWVPNDFTVLWDGAYWHLIGITHPCPDWFADSESRPPEGGADVHEAEWQLFHAISQGRTLRDSLIPGGFVQVEQVLPASQRPGERPDIWAPIIWRLRDEFAMLYSPNPMRLAVSKDLKRWSLRGEVLDVGEPSARDPNIMEEEGRLSVVYLKGDSICLRETTDLMHYGSERTLYTGRPGIAMESPILKRIHGWYYLLYCIYDASDIINGFYDYRTFVHAAPSLEGLMSAPCVAQLRAHAPELLQDERGDWYIASVEWPKRGVSIAPIGWRDAPEFRRE